MFSFSAFQATLECLWIWPIQCSCFIFKVTCQNVRVAFDMGRLSLQNKSKYNICSLNIHEFNSLNINTRSDWISSLTNFLMSLNSLNETCLVKELAQASLPITLLCNVPSGTLLNVITKLEDKILICNSYPP
jgi:hypothetical protein